MPTTVERLQVDVSADVGPAVRDLHRLEQESRRTARVISGMDSRIQGIDTSSALADLRRLEREARRSAGIIGGSISGATSHLGVPGNVTQTWNTYNRQVSQSRDNLKRLAGVATAALGGGVVTGAFVGGIKKAMDFDLVMRQVGVQIGETGQGLTDLSDLAKKMGADTIYSASEAGSAMLELAKGGLTSAQIKGGALQQALTLAAAGGLELADAGSAVVNGMGAFGLKAGQAVRITTALAGAANASSADVSDLTLSLQAGAAAASSAGFSIEETAAAFAIFANNGVKGSDAGTSFKTMIASLTPVTDKAKDTMKKYGLEFTTADGHFKSLAGVAETLRHGLGKLSDVQRSVALETIFGSDASRAAKFIMDAGAKGVRKYTKATNDQKASQDLANVAMSGASGAWQNFTGSVETAVITLGQKALPAVTDILNAGTDMIGNAKGWGEDFREYFGWMGEAATDLYGAIQPLGTVVVNVAKYVDDLPGPVKELGVQAGVAALVFPRLAAGVNSVATSMTVATTRTIGFGQALRATGTQAQVRALGQLGSAARTAAGIGGMVALTQATQQTNEGMAGLTGALGGAAVGFSVGGPLGAAIGGLSGALVGFNSVQQSTLDLTAGIDKATEHYTDTLDENTGAVTRATRAKAYDLLVADKATASAIQVANAYGISTRDIVSSTLGNSSAQERLATALAGLDRRYNRLQAQGRELPPRLAATRDALQQITGAAADQRATLGADLLAAREKARATMNWGEALKGIPKEVKSRLKAEGYDVSRRQIDGLVDQFHLIPDQKRTLYQAFGIDTARNDLAAMNRDWQKVPKAMKDLGIGDAAAGVAATTQEIGANLSTLRRNFSDTQLRVFIRATGSETTVEEVRKSTAAFRKLPPEVRTTIYALGGNATRADIRRVAREAGVTDGKTIRLMFSAIGVTPTRADMKAIREDLARTGDKPANLKTWQRGLTDGITGGKRSIVQGKTDMTDLLRGSTKVAPDMTTFQRGLVTSMNAGRTTARNGAVGIGSDVKFGFGVGFSGAAEQWSFSMRLAVNAAIAAGRKAADAHSPSRETDRLGRDMSDGLDQGIRAHAKKAAGSMAGTVHKAAEEATKKAKAGREAIRRAGRDLVADSVQAFRESEGEARRYLASVEKFADKSLKGHARASVAGLVERDNARVAALYAKRRALDAAQARASETLSARTEARKSLRDDTANGIMSSASILTAGYDGATIAASARDAASAAQEFASLLGSIQGKYRQEIVEEVARALAGATGTDAASINASYAAIAQTAKTASSGLSSAFYDTGVEAAKGIVAGLNARRKDVEGALLVIAKSMQAAIRKALGIKSPSRVMAEVGAYSAQGLVQGLLGQERQVSSAGDRLARAIVTAPPRLPVGSTSARRITPASTTPVAAGSPSFVFHTYNPQAEPTSRTAVRALDKAANLSMI